MPGHLDPLFAALDAWQPNDPMPVLFVGHGNPMHAIQDTVFSTTWDALGRRLPTPEAILCISAHWVTPGFTRVSAADRPSTLHDFSGFPQALFAQRYPAPGSPATARRIIAMVDGRPIAADDQRGLDHGVWSVLTRMFPKADIPVLQLSLDYRLPPRGHYRLARQLIPLRDMGVLILGSGNLVHNLGALRRDAPPYDWADAFDAMVTDRIDRGADRDVVDFQAWGNVARLAHPTWEHFLPLIYTLGQRDGTDRHFYFNDAFDLASVSMRSLVLVR